MATGVLSLTEKKRIRQTTFRAEADLLRKARFYLNEEGKSVAQFLNEELETYVRQREKKSLADVD